jgi:hypothetical protein
MPYYSKITVAGVASEAPFAGWAPAMAPFAGWAPAMAPFAGWALTWVPQLQSALANEFAV